MIAIISKSTLRGDVVAAASKSAMQRACALALMNLGTTVIENPGESDDDKAAIDIIRKCGARVAKVDGCLQVDSNGNVQPHHTIHCGESGLSVRMFTPILALSNSSIQISGHGSLNARPMRIFEEILPKLSVKIKTTDGFLPMEIQGPLEAQDCEIDGSASSQYVTGILFALAKSTQKKVSLTVSNLTSRPYVDLSLQMLAHFGYAITNEAYHRFEIEPLPVASRHIVYTTEGDWSGASFLLVAAAIAGTGVTVRGLDQHSLQADRAIMEVFLLSGVQCQIGPAAIFIGPQSQLLAFDFDATHCPDLFPPLVALAAFCKGTSTIRGASRLVTKESNRLEALIDVFSRMGVVIHAAGDAMVIEGTDRLKGAEVDGHHDHRIVMACAIAALRAEEKITITGAEAINKSYPGFFMHLLQLGAAVSLD